jgi:hypothetical protein
MFSARIPITHGKGTKKFQKLTRKVLVMAGLTRHPLNIVNHFFINN